MHQLIPNGKCMPGTEDRFWSKVIKQNNTDQCWLWTGGTFNLGYGAFYDGKNNQLAHRVAYRLVVREPKKHLDHLCRNRFCVNPWHPEEVSHWTNNARGVGISANNLRKTHCLRGHALEGENVYNPPQEPHKRQCKACQSVRSRRWQILNKE